MGMLMLRELLRQNVEVDVYLPRDQTPLPPLPELPGLRIITRRSSWGWDRWYSRTASTAFFTSLIARTLNLLLLNVRLLIEHRRRKYDAVFQLSTVELFLLGTLRRWAPPIVVYPCSHAAGELRWHRAEQSYALKSERRRTHFSVRALLHLRSRLQPKQLARADLIVGPSLRFLDLVHRDYLVPRTKMKVLRHPVDLDRFSLGASDEPLPSTDLLYISRISARKGVEDIVALSHRLDDLSESVRLLVIGGTTLSSDYSAHLAGLNPRVATYVGSVPGDDIPALMRTATMLLVPSRYEPGSIVTGEALASGVPVVLSDEVGPAEVLSGRHVRIFRAGDVDELEAAVRSLLVDVGEDRDGLRRAARMDAEEHFAVETLMAHLVEMIASVRKGKSLG